MAKTNSVEQLRAFSMAFTLGMTLLGFNPGPR